MRKQTEHIMRPNLYERINEFFETTTIHGLFYISLNQTKCTRIIWTVVVLLATGTATYFLYQTVSRFEENYTSTNMETRSIKEFPFPAITFDPGDYNTKDAFLRNIANQFEFTRYEDGKPLRDNTKFLNLFNWIVSPMAHDQ